MRYCIPHIVGATGRDGRGPSVIEAFALHGFNRALAQKGIRPKITIFAADPEFNEELYSDIPDVDVRHCPHGAILHKAAGSVDLLGTRRQLLRYPEEVSDCIHDCYRDIIDEADLVVSTGAPHAVFAASLKGKPAIEIIDHSWAQTFMAVSIEGRILEPQLAAVIDTITFFEAQAARVYLLPEYLTPPMFAYHFLRVAPGRVRSLNGILGPRISVSPEEAREKLDLDRSMPIAVFTGGGTPVWTRLEQAILNEVCSTPQATFAIMVPHAEDKKVFLSVVRGKIRLIPRRSYDDILSSATIIVSRCGAGIVMDVFRRPKAALFAVPEIGHSQVEGIRAALLKRGLALDSSILKAFTQEYPRSSGIDWVVEAARQLLQAVETILDEPSALSEVVNKVALIPVEQEKHIAEEVLRDFL